ncbi:PAP2/haloperoxidase-like protein [Chondrus crispus]|uniref:PAP2/haloperoxidase-like protein n=1 Tax=Chondrus crispus TaxID=2769 RepID=R7QGE4_CHOCR|nr:PAP2/haloperoxidase-like protein [Chondrus crispus]CDF36848.1 PAP2/haloperoxidase-like protein [Chondrus crispus]|eukprot:XP_005716667.1 PAP2/haloperoxidase-like protein [Chondrus crispus]
MRAALFTALTLLILGAALAVDAPPGRKTPNAIDRESGVLASLVFPEVFDRIVVDGLETPIQFRATTYLNIAAWNAWCNYHPTAADIFNRTRFRRPASEHTRDNKNVAVLYALFRLYEASPVSFGGNSGIPVFSALLEREGLNPNDRSTDMSTPVGIGNRAGRDTARLMAIDGWNAEGDIAGTPAQYRQPFADYTGYTPKNSPWKISHPFRWQPLLESNGRGFFFRQENVVPFAGRTIAFGLTRSEVRARRAPAPFKRGGATVKTALKSDVAALRRHARKVLATSAALTTEQRVLAEYFDNKGKAFRTEDNPAGLPGIATALRFGILGPANDWNLDDDMVYGLGGAVATLDSMVTAWKEKRRVDAVRPTGQTMEFLFGERKVKVWGGPGKKAVRIRAGDWQPYIRTMPHQEFPSGSSCTCSALVEHAKLNAPREDLPFGITVPKGSSKFYPGQVPEKDTRIEFKNLSEWSELCGVSRLYAGVHFEPSIQAGVDVCKGIGESSQKFAEELRDGRLMGKWMTWLPEDTEKFWEEE